MSFLPSLSSYSFLVLVLSSVSGRVTDSPQNNNLASLQVMILFGFLSSD